MKNNQGKIFEANPLEGVGVGLRSCHYNYILNNKPKIPWFEVLSDNYLMAGGPQLAYLEAIRANYPVAMHSVGMSIGSTDELNWDYLKKIKNLIDHINPTIVSDHLCWISIDGSYLHDLLPLPYIEEAIDHVVHRIEKIQEFLGTRILIENVSSYLEYKMSMMTEWEFLNTIANRADCWILLDVNNVYVSSSNHNEDPYQFIQNIDSKRVKQYHLAGFTDKEKYLFDTHSEPIHQSVWLLYQETLKNVGNKPTLIEWDGEIPKFTKLIEECRKAQIIMDKICL
jgi:uncharacterized protein